MSNTIDQRKEAAKEICRNYGIALSVENLKEFANILVPFKVLRGHKLVNEGDVCKYMFYIQRGLVVQYYKKKDVEVTEYLSHEGDMVICIESYFLQEPSRICAKMLEPGMVYGIPHDEMTALCSRSYEMCCLAFAIERRSAILQQQKADTIRFETAKERYVRTLKNNPEIIRRAPLHLVASFLQMTPETLSRVRAQVNEEGLS